MASVQSRIKTENKEHQSDNANINEHFDMSNHIQKLSNDIETLMKSGGHQERSRAPPLPVHPNRFNQRDRSESPGGPAPPIPPRRKILQPTRSDSSQINGRIHNAQDFSAHVSGGSVQSHSNIDFSATLPPSNHLYPSYSPRGQDLSPSSRGRTGYEQNTDANRAKPVIPPRSISLDRYGNSLQGNRDSSRFVSQGTFDSSVSSHPSANNHSRVHQGHSGSDSHGFENSFMDPMRQSTISSGQQSHKTPAHTDSAPNLIQYPPSVQASSGISTCHINLQNGGIQQPQNISSNVPNQKFYGERNIQPASQVRRTNSRSRSEVRLSPRQSQNTPQPLFFTSPNKDEQFVHSVPRSNTPTGPTFTLDMHTNAQNQMSNNVKVGSPNHANKQNFAKRPSLNIPSRQVTTYSSWDDVNGPQRSSLNIASGQVQPRRNADSPTLNELDRTMQSRVESTSVNSPKRPSLNIARTQVQKSDSESTNVPQRPNLGNVNSQTQSTSSSGMNLSPQRPSLNIASRQVNMNSSIVNSPSHSTTHPNGPQRPSLNISSRQMPLASSPSNAVVNSPKRTSGQPVNDCDFNSQKTPTQGYIPSQVSRDTSATQRTPLQNPTFAASYQNPENIRGSPSHNRRPSLGLNNITSPPNNVLDSNSPRRTPPQGLNMVASHQWRGNTRGYSGHMDSPGSGYMDTKGRGYNESPSHGYHSPAPRLHPSMSASDVQYSSPDSPSSLSLPGGRLAMASPGSPSPLSYTDRGAASPWNQSLDSPGHGLYLSSPGSGYSSPAGGSAHGSLSRQSSAGTPTSLWGPGGMGGGGSGRRKKDFVLPMSPSQPPMPDAAEIDLKYQEIMKRSGILNIENQNISTNIRELEHLGELGHGTCGHVVKMKHAKTGKIMAVKQMRRSGNRDENKRIIMDLDVVIKSHNCPYIVQCIGTFITSSDVWICMELMSTCLEKLLKLYKHPFPEHILGKIAVATVKALHYLKEEHGVIHRDVKPSNILLDERGHIKLCDFGISGRLVDSKAKTRSAGCAAYMAPERIDPPDPSKPDYDIRADVWALGISLVELATGSFPYKNCTTDFEVLTRVLTDDPPVPSPSQGFSHEFCSFVNHCLTKDYQRRPKYKQLLNHSFIKRYTQQKVDVAQWYAHVLASSTPAQTPGQS